MTSLIENIDINLSFNDTNVRVIGSYDKPLFVVKDICKILGLSNTTEVLKNIPDKWIYSEKLNTLNRGIQDTNLVSEAGLYKIIMRSNKEIAQSFQEWVCGEVLPSIRKKGEYRMNEEYQLKLKQLEEDKLKIEGDKMKVEEEKAKLEEENKKLTKKYVKPPKEVYDGKNVVYLMTTEDGEKSREYVVGKAQDLANRKEDYNHNKIHNFKVIYYISCKSSRIMDILESVVLSKMGKYRNKAGRDVFELPKENDIDLFTNLFDDVLKFFGDVEDQHIVFAKKTQVVDKEKLAEYRKEYYEEHKEEILEQRKEYYEENKEKIEEYRKEYVVEKADFIAEQAKKKYERNREEYCKNAMEYYEDRKEDILEQRKEFYVDNKEQILKERADYYKENYETKIKVQRQKKESCECGMIVSHYCMKKHKQSARHIARMENVSS
jgi:prophage antirepressor-like protein